MLLFALTLFLGDFFLFTLLEKWTFFFLMAFFITYQIKSKTKPSQTGLFLVLLLIEDFFFQERFGLGLIYLIPIMLLAPYLRSIFSLHTQIFHLFLLFSLFIIQNFCIKKYLLNQNISFNSTIPLILINMIIITIVIELKSFWGPQGSRS